MAVESFNGKSLSCGLHLIVNAESAHQTMRGSDHAFVPVGEGSVVSIEFNLLYRWHATLSAQDTAWTTKKFEEFLNGQNPSQVRQRLLSSYTCELTMLDRLP